MTLHRLTSRRYGRWEGWRHKTAPNSVTRFRPVNCCRIEHDFYHWFYRRGMLELRNRSALAVNCWVIIHCLEVICKVDQIMRSRARVIFLLTTDRQTVIYYSTIHALELIYFNSNTQKTMKKAFRTFKFFSFPPLHKEIPPTILTVIQTFRSISYVFNATKTTLHRLTSWKWKLTSPKIKMASERR